MEQDDRDLKNVMSNIFEFFKEMDWIRRMP